MWARDERETLFRLDAWNRLIHQIRGRIEHGLDLLQAREVTGSSLLERPLDC
jgi:hypothetical protein